jgi:hypothetical protein
MPRSPRPRRPRLPRNPFPGAERLPDGRAVDPAVRAKAVGILLLLLVFIVLAKLAGMPLR